MLANKKTHWAKAVLKLGHQGKALWNGSGGEGDFGLLALWPTGSKGRHRCRSCVAQRCDSGALVERGLGRDLLQRPHLRLCTACLAKRVETRTDNCVSAVQGN